MEYEIRISESAERDIDEILQYMTEKLASPQAAADWVGELEKRYGELSKYPRMYGQPNNEALRQIGYRRFMIKNYVLFYRVNDTLREVIIARVFYCGRNYEKYL